MFIEVRGSQRIESDTIKSYMTVKPGDLYDDAEVDRSLKILFNTGLFADVAIRYENSGLIVFVIENPIINRIDFEGNSALKDDKFEEEIELGPRSVYTRSKVQADVQRLIELYRRSGRFSFNQSTTKNSSTISVNEAYKILNLDIKKKPSKEDVNKAYIKIQKKIHPDVSPETSRLSAIVNEAKEVVLGDIS